jgi:hypothetical protein
VGRPAPASVPLSGFLNPSAASWQTRVPRPCFVPQPPVIATFGAFPSSAIVHPSRGDWLPCRYPPACNDAPPPTLSPAVSPTPTPEDAVAWFPRRLWVPFSRARRPASRSPWIEGDGTAMFRQLHRLRSIPPAVESVHATTSCPAATADALVAFCPSRVRPDALGASNPSRPKGQGPTKLTSKLAHSAARTRGPQPPHPGETSPPTEEGESACSAVPSPLQDWTAPPLGGNSFSHDLCTTVARRGGPRSF